MAQSKQTGVAIDQHRGVIRIPILFSQIDRAVVTIVVMIRQMYKFMVVALFVRCLSISLTCMADTPEQTAKSSLSTAELRRLDEFAAQCKDQGLYGKATEAYELALEKARRSLGDHHRDVAQLHLSLAGNYRLLGEPIKATQELNACLLISQRAVGETNLLAATALNQLGMLANSEAKNAEAKLFYRRSMEMLEQIGEEAKSTLTAVTMNLGLLYYHEQNSATATPLFERSLQLIQDAGTPETANTAQVLNTLAWVYFDAADYNKASELLQKSLKIRNRILGPAHPDLADSFDLLAVFAVKTSDYKRAIAWRELALSLREKAFGLHHPSVADTLIALSYAQDAYGDYAGLTHIIF